MTAAGLTVATMFWPAADEQPPVDAAESLHALADASRIQPIPDGNSDVFNGLAKTVSFEADPMADPMADPNPDPSAVPAHDSVYRREFAESEHRPLNVPSPEETVIRGNDGDDPSPSGEFRQVQAITDENSFARGGQFIPAAAESGGEPARAQAYALPSVPATDSAQEPSSYALPAVPADTAVPSYAGQGYGDAGAPVAQGTTEQGGQFEQPYGEFPAAPEFAAARQPETTRGEAALTPAADETRSVIVEGASAGHYIVPGEAGGRADKGRPASGQTTNGRDTISNTTTPEPEVGRAPRVITPPPADSNPPRYLGTAAQSDLERPGALLPTPAAPDALAPANGSTADGYDQPTYSDGGNQYGDSGYATPAIATNPPSTNPVYSDGSPAPLSLSGDSMPAGEGAGVPGAEVLDGIQSPALTVEKSAPAEIQVGKQTTFALKITNVGKVAAHDVQVFDQVPKGTQLVDTKPHADASNDGGLHWRLGTLQPGDERVVAVQLLPLAEGEIGSVAQVTFGSQASVRTICTKPELRIAHSGPKRVLIGELVKFDITISNPGTGAATNVILEEDVPEGLLHSAGNELEFEVGTLKPGETRKLQLTLKADKPGLVRNKVLIRGDANLLAEHVAEVEVIAPQLQVAVNGPKLRYLQRVATYEVSVANPGTAAAKEVELVTYLPKGMKFLSADHKGQYEPRNHAVYWSLEELPAQQSGVAKLQLLPHETGAQQITVEGRAALGLKDAFEKSVQVEGLAELQFTIADEADPIEVGNETVYVITLSNSGSSASTNVQLNINVPAQLQPIAGDGPTQISIQGNRVQVNPLARLAPGEKAVYKLRVRGLEAGPQRIQVQLISQETPVPVNKEEITRIYSDN